MSSEIAASKGTGRGIRIAVVDSGVHPGHDHINGARLLDGIAIAGDGRISTGEDVTLDRLGHGTAVTAAIQEKAPEADIVPVRIFHEGLKTTGMALITAIDWAAEQGVALVNLSLGSTNPGHASAFAAAVERAHAAGTILVAPCAVDDAPCLPGSLPGVIGVDVSWDIAREAYRAAEKEDAPFVASGYPRPIPGVPLQRNLYGTSFATAQMTGFAARALEGIARSPGPAPLPQLRAAMRAIAALQQAQAG